MHNIRLKPFSEESKWSIFQELEGGGKKIPLRIISVKRIEILWPKITNKKSLLLKAVLCYEENYF